MDYHNPVSSMILQNAVFESDERHVICKKNSTKKCNSYGSLLTICNKSTSAKNPLPLHHIMNVDERKSDVQHPPCKN